jgi:nucleoside-diphosphate-sugar epimerase
LGPLTAQPLVRESYEDPVRAFETNVMGTVHLHEAFRQAEGVKVVINVTSDKCYDNREWVWGYRSQGRRVTNIPAAFDLRKMHVYTVYINIYNNHSRRNLQ